MAQQGKRLQNDESKRGHRDGTAAETAAARSDTPCPNQSSGHPVTSRPALAQYAARGTLPHAGFQCQRRPARPGVPGVTGIRAGAGSQETSRVAFDGARHQEVRGTDRDQDEQTPASISSPGPASAAPDAAILIAERNPSWSAGCLECLRGDGPGWWLYLRRCDECGHIGCCASSPSSGQSACRLAGALAPVT